MNDTTDEQDLIQAAQQGDDAAMETLINRYQNKATWIAKSYFLPGADRDDMKQEALIGLFKAVRDYKGGEVNTFTSFVALCVTRQCITGVKTYTRQKHQHLNKALSIDAPTATVKNEDGKELSDFIPDKSAATPEEAVVSSAFKEELLGVIVGALSDYECDVLRLYAQSASYAQVADKLAKTAKSVDNALLRIRAKITKNVRASEGLRAFLGG